MTKVEQLKERKKLYSVFNIDKKDSLLDSAYYGYHGRIFTNDVCDPQILLIDVGHTFFFFGDATHEEAEELIRQVDKYAEMHADDCWRKKIVQIYPDTQVRQRFEMDESELDIDYLLSLSKIDEKSYVYQEIDQEIYNQLLTETWTSSMVENFADVTDFLSHGLGYVLKDKNGCILSAASSFIRYSKGFEVEIATHKNHRRKGYAKAVGAKFISETMKKGLLAHWDAANVGSKKLAEKLGYKLKTVYTIMDV